ncbi:hypothetical protein [Flavobacterium sp.]|jgi:hypothetical protein|uniref:hypothetical protein n=1 Tax=Flavobacterium sp. TaxID=239 RepID=UPI0037BE8835
MKDLFFTISLFISLVSKSQICDNIILSDGTEIPSKIEEIRLNEIAYRKCDFIEGPLYVSLKSNVFMIIYANGTREVIENKTLKTEETDNSAQFKKLEDQKMSVPNCVKVILKDKTIKYGVIKKINKSTIKFTNCELSSLENSSFLHFKTEIEKILDTKGNIVSFNNLKE